MFIINLRYLAEEVVERYQVCQQINACHTKVGKGKGPGKSRTGVFWEVDFTEVKAGKKWVQILMSFCRYLFRMGGSLPHQK